MKKSKMDMKPGLLCLIAIVMIVTASVSGCISITKKPGAEEMQDEREGVAMAEAPQAAITPQPTETTPKSSVEFAQPLPTETPSRIQPSRPPPRPTPPVLEPIFTDTFSLGYTTVTLLVDALKAPLIIDYTISSNEINPRISFLVLTVRDADTLEVVAEEGYGRIYSGNTEQRITIYRQGRYYLTLYGNKLDVTLSITTGDSVASSASSTPETPTQGPPEWMKQGW